MRRGSTQTITIGKAFFHIIYLWLEARITLPKGDKPESSDYPRGFQQARPGTITASYDDFGKNPSKATTGIKFKIYRTYFVHLRWKALESGSAYTQAATIHPDLWTILNIDYRKGQMT